MIIISSKYCKLTEKSIDEQPTICVHRAYKTPMLRSSVGLNHRP